jgi:Tfp pilus assembly protein PilE
MRVLVHFGGVLHRNDYHSYRNIYDQVKYSLCRAHLIRNFKHAVERDNQQEWAWAQPTINLLLRANTQIQKSATGVLNVRCQVCHRKEYDLLAALSLSKKPLKTKKNDKAKKRTAQSKNYNLLLRFQNKVDDILRFMSDHNAKFINN